jgi:hypothetical protein
VQELLASFVTVADEVGRLQRGKDAECSMFQSFCEEGHYGGRTVPTRTRQGIYAIAPSGRFLASVNSTQPDKVAAMLQKALAAWRELPDADRRLPPEKLRTLEATRRFEDRYPAGGLVLAEYVRDLGREVSARDWRTQAWNEDQAWFTEAEARAMVPAEVQAGAVVEVPERLVERLARLHLVDTVRGQSPSFPKDAVVTAELRSEVALVDGVRAHLRLAGRTHAQQKGRWVVVDGNEPEEHERGVKTELTGRAVWDMEAERFVAFDLLAIGERWGATHYNERSRDLGPTRIGFAFVLAGEGHSRVAPAFW